MKASQKILGVLMIACAALCPALFAVAYHQWMGTWDGGYGMAMGFSCIACMIALVVGGSIVLEFK